MPHFDAAKASIATIETERKRFSDEQLDSLQAQINRLIDLAEKHAGFAFDVRLVLTLDRAVGGPIANETKLQIAREFFLNTAPTAAEVFSATADVDTIAALARTTVQRKDNAGADTGEPFFLVYLEHISLRSDWPLSMAQVGYLEDGINRAGGLLVQYAARKQQLAPIVALESYRAQMTAQFAALKSAHHEFAASDARFALDTIGDLTKALMLMEDRASAAALANEMGNLTSGFATKIQAGVDKALDTLAPVLGADMPATDSATP